jgi:uncharacterized membrane protein
VVEVDDKGRAHVSQPGHGGKDLGHQFDADQLKALAVNMAPNTSAIVVVIEDQHAEAAATALGEYDAKVVTVTLGDQHSGQLTTLLQ